MNTKVLYHCLGVMGVILSTSTFSTGAIYEKTGFYAGIAAGASYCNVGNFSEGGIKITDAANDWYGARRNKISTCGFDKNFDAFVGYIVHLPQEDWLAGIEFGIEKPFYKKNFYKALQANLEGAQINEDWQYRNKTLYVAKLHAKIGKILSKKWFIYGLTGIDVNKTEFSMKPVDIEEINRKKCICGFAVGLGAEREISTNWHLGL